MPVLPAKMHTRPATLGDLTAISALLTQDAAARAAHDGALWPRAADAVQRIERVFCEETRRDGPTRWLVAEADGAIKGVARFGAIPCPPIYHMAGSLAFVLFDDTYADSGAPADVWRTLIAEAERAGTAMGAVIFLAAAAPFQRAKLSTLAAAGYDVVTQYLVKHDLSRASMPNAVRAATPADVAAIVAMGARSQECLREANARMWTPHAEAPARFALWMHHSLNLPDRRIFVAAEEGAGFVITQPPSPFHLPLATLPDHLGLIDDFWAADLATASSGHGTSIANDLLAAAEHEFAQRGEASAMVICPVNWHAKQAVLRRRGYRDGNAWMLKGDLKGR